MNADRELLALAAKAAGARMSDYSDRTPDHWTIQHADRVWREWRPLTDDGDALRLAILVGIDIESNKIPERACALVFVPGGNSVFFTTPFFEPWGDDKMAATRRAIVRAAAEIGRAMP